MVGTIVIKNEDDAWSALADAVAGRWDERIQVSFDNWPVFRLTFEGKDFKGGVPTRVMPPILELQKEIYRVYCSARYGTDNIKKLTAKEREMLELVVDVAPGSTKIIAALGKALNEIIKNSNMSGKEVVILVLGVSALLTTSIGWKDWLSVREREHGQDQTVELSKLETERLKIVTEALTQQPELERSRSATTSIQSDISRRLKPDDLIKIANETEPLLNGERAAEIVPPPKAKSVDVRLDGEFVITKVEFPQSAFEPYRFTVTRVLDKLNLVVDAEQDRLTMDQIQVLKDGGFGLRRVVMRINAKELRGNITVAKLVSISWPEPEQK